MTRAAIALVRGCLRLYPKAFRDAYAAEMADDFAQRWCETPVAWRRLRLLARTMINVCLTAAAERRRSALDPPVFPAGGGQATGGPMGSVGRDLRQAWRSLRAQPGFALFVLLTLAVGIGATTAVFSVVDAVLLRPLPLPASDRLVAIWGRFDPESGFNFPRFVLSGPEFVDYRTESRALSGVAAWQSASVTIGGPGADPERVPAANISDNFFSLLRVAPARGRTFTAEESRPNGPRAVILAYGYWRARFGGDPAIVGRTVPINGTTTTIVGVMPEGFAYPGTTAVWLPLGLDPASPGNRQSHSLRAIGRLADGTSFATAQAELASLMASWKARYPDVHTGHYLTIRPLIEDVAGDARPALRALLAATICLLLIACANAAGLLMSRGESRVREMSIRAALGARKGALVRMTLMETTLLSLVGGLAGVALAWAGVRALVAIDPSSIPRSTEITLDARVIAFGLVLSLITAAASGLLPALRGAAIAARGALRESSHSTTLSGGRQRVRRLLVALEVAVGVVLVIGAGLMIRGFEHLSAVDPGFDVDGVVTATVALPQVDYKEAPQVEDFFASLADRMRGQPGVRSISATNVVPLLSDGGVWDFEIEGRPHPGAGQAAWNAAAVIARPDLMATLGTPIERGRFFTSGDNMQAMTVAAISESMARSFFPGVDPIGRRIRVAGTTGDEAWMTIVGIVGDVRVEGLDAPPRPTYYIPHAQVPKLGDGPTRRMAIVIRTDRDQDSVIAALRSAVRGLDPRLPLFDVFSLDALLNRSIARPRFATLLLTVFAVLGALLGASGLYGVLSYTVATRRSEIGIRRALGAPAARIVHDVLRGGLIPVAGGLIAGVTASFWTSRMLTSQLYGVSPADVPTYASAVVVVSAVAIVSCLLPARRALRVSPLTALRSE